MPFLALIVKKLSLIYGVSTLEKGIVISNSTAITIHALQRSAALIVPDVFRNRINTVSMLHPCENKFTTIGSISYANCFGCFWWGDDLSV